jgi:hypothetical protein
MEKKLLKVKEVAGILNVSKASVYAYAASGVLRAVYMPLTHISEAVKHNKPTLRFKPDEIERFLLELAK